MAKSIKRNYVYSTIFNVLLVTTPLVTAPYISRVLQADGVGAVSFVASVVAYFNLFAVLGTYGYGQREISYVRDDPQKRSTVFWEVQTLRVINTLITLAIYLVFVFLCAKTYRTIFLVFTISILYTACDVSWFLAGLEEFGKIALRNIAIKFFDIAFVFTFINSKSDVALYAFGYAFFNIAAAVVVWKYIPAYVSKPDLKSIRPFRNIKTILSLFVPGIASQVYTVLDKIMIGIFTEGTFENGYYEQSLKISRMVLPLVISLAGVMVSRIGYLFGIKDYKQISVYMYRSYNFVWFIGIPLCLGLIGISNNFVPWFFGPGYEKVAGLMKISSLLILAIGLNYVTGIQYLIPTKRQNLYTYAVIIGAAVNFSMNIIFIRIYKSYGAIVASVLAETVILFVEIYFVHGEISLRRIIFSGRNYYIAGGIMLAVILFMNARLTPSFTHTFTMIFTGAAIYFSLLFILRDKFFLEYSAKPIAFLKKKLMR